jgi:hypothetical protein
MRDELPHPHLGETMEEPLRPLLAVVDRALHALQLVLHAEYIEPISEHEYMPDDPAPWIAEALTSQIDCLRADLGLYALALKRRNMRPASRRPETTPDS